jgi:hypothetical protein
LIDPPQRFMVRWKIVETSTVTDDALEAVVNDWVQRGWTSGHGLRDVHPA